MLQFADGVEGPASRSPPVFQSPPVVLAVIAVLAIIHVALYLGGEAWQVWSLYALAFIPARYGSAPFPMIEGSQVWSFLTYAFLHGSFIHLLFNSLWLLIFGTVVARYFGAGRFLVLWAAAAIAGALATLLMHWGETYIMIGASGAVSGMMAASVPIMYGHSRVRRGWPTGDPMTGRALSFAELLRHRNALIFTAVWLVITLLSGTDVGGSTLADGAAIAWEAHIGGFIAGLLGFYLLHRDLLRA